jgi:hypothetical protein
MRKLTRACIASAMLMALVAVAAAPASSAPGGAFPPQSRYRGHSALELHRAFLSWVLGSSTNTIFNGGCGEVIGGIYYAPVSVGPGTEAECDVPVGTPIVLSPAGAFSEIPTWGADDAAVEADAALTFSGLEYSQLSVDGRSIDPDPYTLEAGAYDVVIDEGSAFDLFCEGLPAPCTVDFEGGDTVRFASVGQVILLRPLPPGTHLIEFEDKFTTSPVLDMTLTVHVG